MKKFAARVLNSRFGKIARLGALSSGILTILNTAITLPTALLLRDASAHPGTLLAPGTSGTGGVPEMPMFLIPLFCAALCLLALQVRRRFVSAL